MSEAIDTSAPISIRTGNILHGKYRLERELGRGAMGTVWSAIHLSLDQRVAIKVISSEYANSTEAIQRFHTEAKAAAKLRSRYVVQVYDDGETPEGLPYIVMEYLEGESLEDRVARDRDIPLAEAVRIASHVGRALSRAHGRGIVHRDLKPANIFITKNDDDEMGWVAKVLDFGIAKLDDNREKSTTKTGTVLGTPLFMSAEQVRGASAVDARADLYSLGMVFFNMLTGRYAFEGTSFGDLLVSICTDPLPRLSEHAPWVSQPLDDWFQKACARDVGARFQTADEMVDELYAAANLSFDGRMSFSDENSSLNQLVITDRNGKNLRAADTGNEARNNYATAATQHAPELATNTGAASVHTIPGIVEKKRWVVSAALAAVGVLVLGLGVAWFVSDDSSLPSSADAHQLAPAPELATPQPAEAQTVHAADVEPEATPATEDTKEPQAIPDTEPDESKAADSAAADSEAAEPDPAAPPKATAKPRPVRPKALTTVTRPKTTTRPKPATTSKQKSGDVDIGF